MAKYPIQTVIQLSKAKKKPVHQNQPQQNFCSAEASLMYRPCISQAPKGMCLYVIHLAHLHGSIVYHIELMFVNSALADFVDCSGKMRLRMLYCAKGVLMMASENLSRAKATKNDEFYTLYDYIQKEINAYLEFDPDVFRDKVVLLPCDDPEWSNFTRFFAQNFENFGLKKLISTSYAADSKPEFIPYQISLFESEAPQFDESKTRNHGKIFTLTRDKNQSGKIDIDDLEWDYLEGDGDFRSNEIRVLRDEADIIVTNPPFSKFRDFLAWIVEASKKFLIIGNMNAITYKEVFSLIKENRLWLGATCNSEDMVFAVPEGAVIAPQDREKAARLGYVGNYTRLGNACWYTNLDHGRRHQPLSLMTMDDNIKFSKHKEIRGKGYLKYDNYDAIDVPFTDAIPADYEGVMGVPITYLDKYCPEQFEILGRRGDLVWAETECDFYTPPPPEIQQKYKAMNKTWRVQNTYILSEDGIPLITYGRIFIRVKKDVDKL